MVPNLMSSGSGGNDTISSAHPSKCLEDRGSRITIDHFLKCLEDRESRGVTIIQEKHIQSEVELTVW